MPFSPSTHRCGPALAVLVSALFLQGCPEPATTSAGTEPAAVATVNDHPIPAETISEGLRRFRREHGHLSFRTEEDLAHVRQRLLEDQIDRVLIRIESNRLGIKADDERVERALLRRRANYPDRSFEEYLVEAGIPMSSLREEIRHRLLLQELFGREVNPRVVVSEEDIQARYDENPEEWSLEEQVKVSQIVVGTEEEANQILRSLRRGEDFARAAAAHSLGPEGRRGGDLGWFTRGTMPPPIDDISFTLPVGRLSEVVESPYGFHIFLVNERRSARSRPLSEVERTISNELRLEREREAQRAFLDNLRSKAQVVIDKEALSQLR